MRQLHCYVEIRVSGIAIFDALHYAPGDRRPFVVVESNNEATSVRPPTLQTSLHTCSRVSDSNVQFDANILRSAQPDALCQISRTLGPKWLRTYDCLKKCPNGMGGCGA